MSIIRVAKIVGILLFVLFTSIHSFAQNKYNFDFEQNWEWIDLLLSEQCQMFGVSEQVKFLRDEQDINEGRKLFRELTKLDSLNQLRLLPDIIKSDLQINRALFTKLIIPVAESVDYSDNFGGGNFNNPCFLGADFDDVEYIGTRSGDKGNPASNDAGGGIGIAASDQ